MASEHDQRLAEAQRERDQQADRDHRDHHVEQQFVRFLGRGLAVVARDVHCDVRGDHAALQRLDALQHVAPPRRPRWCPCAWRPRWSPPAANSLRRRVHHAHVLGGLLAAVGHFGDVAHEDRPVVRHADHHVAHVFGGAQKLAGLEQELAVARVELARGSRRFDSPSAPATCSGDSCSQPASPASSATRTSRRCPPISVTAETSGTCLIASCTCAAMRRSSKSP